MAEHRIYICPAEGTGNSNCHEHEMVFQQRPVFYIQYKDKKYRLRFDGNNNLVIRGCDFKKLDISHELGAYPMLVIEGN